MRDTVTAITVIIAITMQIQTSVGDDMGGTVGVDSLEAPAATEKKAL